MYHVPPYQVLVRNTQLRSPDPLLKPLLYQVVSRHAKRTPLDNIACLQKDCFKSQYFSKLAILALAVLCMAVFIGKCKRAWWQD